MKNIIRDILKEETFLISEIDIKPSQVALDNVCKSKKFCNAQGKITFGQLRELVEKGRLKRIGTHIGEGGYKATLRLIPWFIPQLALLGFGATWVRVANKIFRPALEETTGYKTWWGKTIMKIFDMVEGELKAEDPLSKIFFISDGLMTMLDEKYKVKFANYISQVADEKPNDEIVPDYFVENELRNWLNQKFLLDPPLQPKQITTYVDNDTKSEVELKENKDSNYDKKNMASKVLDELNLSPWKNDTYGMEYLSTPGKTIIFLNIKPDKEVVILDTIYKVLNRIFKEEQALENFIFEYIEYFGLNVRIGSFLTISQDVGTLEEDDEPLDFD
jgi:hypothetical protein